YSNPMTNPNTVIHPSTYSASDATQFLTRIVGATALAHLLNDLIQAILPAVFPMLKAQFDLSFAQIGLIALIYQLTASVLQPCIGFYTDKQPKPFLLPIGMTCTLIGIGILATATNFQAILLAAAV